MTNNRKGLGKGLGALLDSSEIQLAKEKERVYELDINEISPQDNQPRKDFNEESLLELAESIKKEGVIQPIIVRKNKAKDYRIIAGERRWRASRLAGKNTIPAIIRDLEEEDVLRQALIENIQREDLNPIEEAVAYNRLMQSYGLSQEELAKALAKSRPTVANRLRLLNLDEEVQKMLIHQVLSEGHARALIPLEKGKQIAVAKHVIENKLTVRATENYVRAILDPQKPFPTQQSEGLPSQYALSVKTVEEKLSKGLGVKVRLKDRAGKGKIEIPYKDLDELDRLIDLLGE